MQVRPERVFEGLVADPYYELQVFISVQLPDMLGRRGRETVILHLRAVRLRFDTSQVDEHSDVEWPTRLRQEFAGERLLAIGDRAKMDVRLDFDPCDADPRGLHSRQVADDDLGQR